MGKANVVADALSRKGRCNYLPAVRSTEEESSTRVLPDLSLFNITLTPTLRGEIIAAQKNDAGMAHIKRRIQEGDPTVACFCDDAEGTCPASNLDLSVETEDNLIGKESRRSRPNYNHAEMLCLSNQYTNSHG
jgi:hypothetical protein